MPEPGDAPPCGGERLSVTFAGSTFSFEGLARHQADHVRGYLAELLSPPRSGSVAVEIADGTTAWFRDTAPIPPWGFSLDLDPQPDAVRVAGLPWLGLIRHQPELAAWLWIPAEEQLFFPAAFENFFRVLTAYRLLSRGGALLHSAAIVSDGEAFLFFGPSGAGKTTISRLALRAGAHVLSDDLNAFWMEDGRPHLQRVPFAGDLKQKAEASISYELRAAACLEKGPELRYRPMRPARALAAMLASAPFVNVDRFAGDQLQSNLSGLLRAPAGRLTFSPDHGFNQILRCLRSGVAEKAG